MNRPAQEKAAPIADKGRALIFAVTVAAACAIVYELIIATMSSYLLGNSVHQFSLTIGFFMSAMGLGSWLSRSFNRRILDSFIWVECVLGLVGGVSATALFAAYVYLANDAAYAALMYGLIVVIGALVGLEIPLLTRLMRLHESLKDALAKALAFDYIGALVGAVAFPFVLLKALGLIQTGFVVGLFNAGVGGLALIRYWDDTTLRRTLAFTLCATLAVLGGAATQATRIQDRLEDDLYGSRIALKKQSDYQRIVVTRTTGTKARPPEDKETPHLRVAKRGDDLRLFIDGQIQFSSADEYRYHEALVHPAMSLADDPTRVLILGGGDGLAAREVLKRESVEEITLVDIDPAMTTLCRENPEIVALNEGSLSHPKVRIVNRDAYKYVEAGGRDFDAAIIDLPDPNHETLAKLYSVEFYQMLRLRMSPGGVIVTQSSSPYFARAAFWCIHRSMREAGFAATLAYHIDVPSLGDWGFNLSALRPVKPEDIRVTVPTLYLTDATARSMFVFGKDVAPIDVAPNTLLKPILIHYYDDPRWAYY